MEEQKKKRGRPKKICCKNCGSQEFITKPNRYDIYEIMDGELMYAYSHYIDDEIQLYCRDCEEILEDAGFYIMS